MRVELRAYGPRGSLGDRAQGIGRAVLKAESQREARVLSLLVGGDILAKAQVLFSITSDGLTDEERAILERVVDRKRGEYHEFLGGDWGGGS